MREMKFRSLYEGKWYYQTLDEVLIITLAAFRLGEHRTQFTDLLDNKGREIFEGDIVQYYARGNTFDNELKPVKAKIIWVDYLARFIAKNIGVNGLRSCDLGFTEVEVIGNIYENPELLNA